MCRWTLVPGTHTTGLSSALPLLWNSSTHHQEIPTLPELLSLTRDLRCPPSLLPHCYTTPLLTLFQTVEKLLLAPSSRPLLFPDRPSLNLPLPFFLHTRSRLQPYPYLPLHTAVTHTSRTRTHFSRYRRTPPPLTCSIGDSTFLRDSTSTGAQGG